MSDESPASTQFTEPPVRPPSFRIVGDPAPLFGALALARKEFKPILRDKHVSVVTRSGDKYEFDYAPLESVIAATEQALAAQGLSVIQPVYSVNDGYEVRTIITHASGSYLESIIYISDIVVNIYQGKREERPIKNQELGSEITYKRRYAYSSMLGVSSEDDDDGNAREGNDAKPLPRTLKNPPAPPRDKPQGERMRQPEPKPQAKQPSEQPPRPATMPPANAPNLAEEAHVPDEIRLAPNTETARALTIAFEKAGLRNKEEQIAFCEKTLARAFSAAPLSFGDGRAILKALEAQ